MATTTAQIEIHATPEPQDSSAARLKAFSMGINSFMDKRIFGHPGVNQRFVAYLQKFPAPDALSEEWKKQPADMNPEALGLLTELVDQQMAIKEKYGTAELLLEKGVEQCLTMHPDWDDKQVWKYALGSIFWRIKDRLAMLHTREEAIRRELANDIWEVEYAKKQRESYRLVAEKIIPYEYSPKLIEKLLQEHGILDSEQEASGVIRARLRTYLTMKNKVQQECLEACNASTAAVEIAEVEGHLSLDDIDHATTGQRIAIAMILDPENVERKNITVDEVGITNWFDGKTGVHWEGNEILQNLEAQVRAEMAAAQNAPPPPSAPPTPTVSSAPTAG